MVSTDKDMLLNQEGFTNVIEIPDNQLLEIKFDTLDYEFIALEKKIKIERTPQAPFSHIMQEEVYASIDAVDFATDFGNKFISRHQVVLGGFEKAVQELIQI